MCLVCLSVLKIRVLSGSPQRLRWEAVSGLVQFGHLPSLVESQLATILCVPQTQSIALSVIVGDLRFDAQCFEAGPPVYCMESCLGLSQAAVAVPDTSCISPAQGCCVKHFCFLATQDVADLVCNVRGLFYPSNKDCHALAGEHLLFDIWWPGIEGSAHSSFCQRVAQAV